MSKRELISIIVPVYMVEHFLPKCIDSILAQTYPNFELILVDDGSPDNSGTICDAYAEKDPRVRVIHKENGGLSSARNAGLKQATGEYIGFIDSDDFIEPNMYECLYQSIQEHDADMSICDFQYVNEEGEDLCTETKIRISEDVISGRKILEQEALSVFWAISWNKLYKKCLFDTVRFLEGKQHEDEFIAHRILIQCQKISVVRKKLYHYIQRRNSITKGETSKARFDAVEASLDRIDDFLTYQIHGKALCKTLVSAMLILSETYQSLKGTDPEIQTMYRRYLTRCRKTIKRALKLKLGMWRVVLLLLYCIPCFGSRVIRFLINCRQQKDKMK